MGGRSGSSGITSGGTSSAVNAWDKSYEAVLLTTQGEKTVDDKMGLGNGGAADKWQNNLSQSESDAVNNYTLEDYDEINSSLRHGNTSSYSSEINAIHNAINKYNLDTPIVVERGASKKFFGNNTSLQSIQKMVGNVVYDKGFTSSTMLHGASFNDPGRINLRIKVPTGKGIGAFIKGVSGFPNEAEFLFDKGSGFRIDGAYSDANGQIQVNMSYVGKA